MRIVDYIILGGFALVVAGVVLHLIKRKKAGKGGCGCGCSGCPSAGACGQKAKEEKNHDEAI